LAISDFTYSSIRIHHSFFHSLVTLVHRWPNGIPHVISHHVPVLEIECHTARDEK